MTQSYDDFWKHGRYRDDVQSQLQGRYSYCIPPRSPAPQNHWALVEYWWSEWLSEAWRCHRDNGGMIAKALFASAQRLAWAMQWKGRRWKNTTYYLLGSALEDFTPKTQFEHFQNPQHCLPTIGKNYFLTNTRAMGKFLHDIKTEDPSLLVSCETRSMTVSQEDKKSHAEGNDQDSDDKEKEKAESTMSLLIFPHGHCIRSWYRKMRFG
jgi:hypothetical protein